MIKLETKRLIIRDPIIDDLESHHELLSNDKVMYYLKDIKLIPWKNQRKICSKEAEHIDYEWHDGKAKTRVEYRLLKSE